MATITIEIPVSVQDKTGSSLPGITTKLNNLAKAAEKVSKIMLNGGSVKRTGLERSMERVNKTLGKSHVIEITAHENATQVLHNVEDAFSKTTEAVMEITAENNATEVIGSAEDQLAAFDGDAGVAAVGIEDNATEVIGSAGDALASYDGDSATAEIGAEDNATEVISSVEDYLSSLNGSTSIVYIEAMNVGAEKSSGSSASNDFSVPDMSLPSVGTGYAAAKRGILGAAAFAGLSLGVGSAIDAFKDFESGMSEVKAISGATEEEFVSLTEKAKYMGSTTKFTATQSAEAFKYMAMAGWKPDQMEAGIEGIMDLAAASGEDLGTTSDIVTDAMTAFGLAAEGFTDKGVSNVTHFADVLAQAASNSNTNVGIMGESFKYAAPLMGAMGYTAEDTALALGIMANAGIKGSMAGTTLRSAISNLSAPTSQMKAAMDKYGISLIDDTGKMRTLKGVMDNVRTALRGLSEDEQAAAVKTIFGKTAMSGMLAVINESSEAYEGLSESVHNADGAAARMREIMLDNLQGSLTLLGSAWEGVQDTFGERISPHIRSIADALTEGMPNVSEAINNAFDTIDPIIEGFKKKIGDMLSSDEWKDADGLDRINIAWDTLIGEPFNEWVTGTGQTLIGDGLRTLFSEASGVFTGEGGLTNWVSLGMIAIGAEKLATGIKAITSAIEAFPGISSLMEITGITGPMIAAGIAAGIAAFAISSAVKSINEQKIETNLAEHFGNLQLSAEEAKQWAGQVVPIEDITAELHVSTVKFSQGEALRGAAEKCLNSINTLQWKIQKAELDTSDVDLETLASQADTFRESLLEQFKVNEEGAEQFINAILPNVEGQQIIDTMSGWFTEDSLRLDSMGDAVSSLIQKSLEAGAESVETATAISILQAKMMEIVNGAHMAQLQGKLDWLQMTSSFAALDPESWKMFVQSVGEYQSEYMNTQAEAYQGFLAQLNELEQNNPNRSGEVEAIRNVVRSAISGLSTDTLLAGWNPIFASLQEAYGSELGASTDWLLGNEETGSSGEVQNFTSGLIEDISRLQNGTAQWGGGDGVFSRIQDSMTSMLHGTLDPTTQSALLDRYQSILPTVDSIRKMIDGQYGANGEKLYEIPQTLMDAYQQALQVGAAGGDEGAMAGLLAQQIASEFGSKEEFLSQLEGAGIDISTLSQAIGGDFETEINRAFAETTPDLDYNSLLSGIFSKMDGRDVDWAGVESLLNEYGFSIAEYLSENGIDISGSEVETKGTVTPTFDEIEVNGDGIAEPLRNAIENSATDAESLAGEMRFFKKANIEVTEAEYDTSAIEGTGEEQELGEVPATANANVALGELSGVEEAYGEMEGEINSAFSEPVDANSTNIMASAVYGGDNGTIAAAYAAFESAAQAAFSTPVSVTASISVNASSSGGGTGPVVKKANGGHVDSPLLSLVGEDGPEFIIPVGSKRRNRGLDLWMQAGAALGVPGFADGGVVGDGYSWKSEDYSTDTSSGSSGSSEGVTIQVNMSPQFNMNEVDENNVLALIRAHMDEFTDDFCEQLSEMLSEAYENRPAV